MADSKITALTAISTVDPTADPLVIVDVSDTSMAASGTTKKSTINQLLGSGGTATLASATITGDLTVRTNKLAVTSTGVAVGATSAAYPLDVTGIINTNSDAYVQGGRLALYRPAGSSYIDIASGQDLVFRGGLTTVGGAGASDLMRLNSTGLGVGEAASVSRLQPRGSTSDSSAYVIYAKNSGGNVINFMRNDGRFLVGNGTTDNFIVTETGNVGIGVTPSAWAAGYKVIQGQIGGFALSNDNSSNNQFRLSSNAYFDTTDNRWEYYGTSTATAYEQRAGEHRFYNAISGSANTLIPFVQAMTLDASGNLLVGTTSQNGSWNTKLTLSNDSGTTKWAVGPYLGGVTNFLISAGASAGVYLNGTAATSWTSASDERLKDIIEPISDAIAKVGSLRAVIGKFKFDENNTRKPFLIAQDIQAVLPEAVDASNPEKLGVAYTDVIPLLVAAIKELTARVQTLETR